MNSTKQSGYAFLIKDLLAAMMNLSNRVEVKIGGGGGGGRAFCKIGDQFCGDQIFESENFVQFEFQTDIKTFF